MTIRCRHTRRDWWPKRRVAGLKRYAFIGDSHMYGVGVAVDETLPAHAGPMLNAARPAWPVEAVNYGVSGYNLWNGWLGIKPELALFDGLVIAVCNNDAEMFSRTFQLHMPDGRDRSFEPDDPFGVAFAGCIADIGQTCQTMGLPVLLIFYNAHHRKAMLRIDDIVAACCAANAIPYIHTLPLYAARNLTREQLIANEGDPHPSSLAHELVARHLVAEMARLGWFADEGEKIMAQAPARIRAAVAAMIGEEHYPEDAVLDWALCALRAKTQVARRRVALGEPDDFTQACALVRAELEAAGRRWHGTRRAEALAVEIAQASLGPSGILMSLQVGRLRQDEVDFALRHAAARPALARLPAPATALPPDTLSPSPAPAFDRLRARFAANKAALEALAPELGLAPLRPLLGLIESLQAETRAQEMAFAALAALLQAHGGELPQERPRALHALLQADLRAVLHSLERAASASDWAPQITRPGAPAYTAIEVVLRTSAVSLPSALMTLRADYIVPHRHSFTSGCMFQTAQQPVTLRFRVPLFYAGRVLLCTVRGPRAATPDDIEVLKLEFIHEPGVRREVAPDEWFRDRNQNLVFPLVCLV